MVDGGDDASFVVVANAAGGPDLALCVPVSTPLIKPDGQPLTDSQGQSSTEPPAQAQVEALSWTGAEAGLMALLGAVMLALGLVLVRTFRRRRTD